MWSWQRSGGLRSSLAVAVKHRSPHCCWLPPVYICDVPAPCVRYVGTSLFWALCVKDMMLPCSSTLFVTLSYVYAFVYLSLHTSLVDSLFTGLFGSKSLWFCKLVHLMIFFSCCAALCVSVGCLYFSGMLLLGVVVSLCRDSGSFVRAICHFVSCCDFRLFVCVFLSWLLWDAACCWATSCLLPSSWPRDHHWHHKVVYGVGTKVSYIYQECEAIS